MSRVIPLIRAAALMPVLRWLRENGRPVDQILMAKGHGYLLTSDPMQPVPLLGGVALMAELARSEVPDLGVRVATETSQLELAVISRSILGARTPREAFTRVAVALPQHCTHEVFSLRAEADGIAVHDTIALPMDQHTRHLIDQYVVALVAEVCAETAAPGPLFTKVEMTPHPDFGFAHLHRWFGDRIVPSRSRGLCVWIAGAVADLPFRRATRDRFTANHAIETAPLRGDGTLASSVRLVLPQLLQEDGAALDRLVDLSGMTRRTLQRRLAAEGTNFTDLLAEVRQKEALRRLAEADTPISEVSRQLGFSQQSALTRAMRRWTGEAPSRLRARSSPDHGTAGAVWMLAATSGKDALERLDTADAEDPPDPLP